MRRVGPIVSWLGGGGEEGGGVPGRGGEPPPHGVGRAVSEVEVVSRVVAQEEPAHRVHARPVGGVVEPDGVAFALVHLLAVLVSYLAVAEDGAEGLAPLQHGAHGEEGIEPVAELAWKA